MTEPKIASDNVLSVIRDFGAPITVAEIGALLGLDMTDEQTRRDVANRAGYLVTSGKANRVGPGMYQAANGVQTAVTATPAPAPAPKTSKAAKAAQADELFERVGKATEALFPKGIPMTRIIEVAELQKAMLKVVAR